MTMNLDWRKYRYPAMVGIFTIGALIILVIIILTLGNQRGTFMKAMLVKAEFENVSGLKKGDNVWLSGVRVGAIREIRIVGKNKVNVQMDIEQGLDSLIRSDSQIRIGSDGVMGNRIIIISPGSPDAPGYTEDIFLKGETITDLHQLTRDMISGSKDLISILENVREITRTARDGKGVINTLLKDSILSENITASAVALRKTSEEAQNFMERGVEVGDQANILLKNINKDGSFINELVSDTLLYPELLLSTRSIRNTTGRLQSITERLESGIGKGGKAGTLPDLLWSNPETGSRLMSILANLDSASRKLDEDLLAARQSFLLRKYFRQRQKHQ
jgi:phospholipid/cholesterol/gamma-HCH transport system substrate-binding protein